MRRSSFRDQFGITLTLPLGLAHRRRARKQRLRRAAIFALLLIGAALLAMGWYLPAKAALAQVLLNRAWTATRDVDGAGGCLRTEPRVRAGAARWQRRAGHAGRHGHRRAS
jgi:CHASE2 domain-containing sensor protein